MKSFSILRVLVTYCLIEVFADEDECIFSLQPLCDSYGD